MIMIYIVSEGSPNGAESMFIKNLLYIYNVKDYSLHFSSGNRRLNSVLTDVSNMVSHTDKVILFVDNVSRIGKHTLRLFLRKWISIFEGIDVAFYHTTYYCFEEIFLSYQYLSVMCNTEYKDICDNLSNSLMNNVDYTTDKELTTAIRHIVGECRTREHISSALLSIITRGILGKFHINKGTLGECWFGKCDSCRLQERCRYRCKLLSSVDKFEHFECATILASDLSFKDVLK